MNEELLKKARMAGTVEKLMEEAEKERIRLERSEAKEYFSILHRNGEITDDELDSVSGGGCGDKTKCPACGVGEPIWYQHKKTGEIKIGCTACPAELDYKGGGYIVKSEHLNLNT